MASRVRFVLRAKKDKYVEVRPNSKTITAALKTHTGKEYIQVKDDNFLSFEVIKALLNIEAVGSDDEIRLELVGIEIRNVCEARLLLKLKNSLCEVKDHDFKIELEQRLSRLKLKELQEKRDS